jgi:hypothetical protein
VTSLRGRPAGRQEQAGSVTLIFEREDIFSRTHETMRIVIPGEESANTYRITLAITDHLAGTRIERSTVMKVSGR